MVYMELYKNHDIVGSRLVPMVASLTRLSITPTISSTQTPKRTHKTLKGVGEKQNGATKNTVVHIGICWTVICVNFFGGKIARDETLMNLMRY